MPDLSRETLLDELEMDAPPPRPKSPLVLMVSSKPTVQKQTLSLAQDLKRFCIIHTAPGGYSKKVIKS